jgi:2-C-methyl-D-erythritol 4-phosphate cytidylyltransferase
MAAGSVAAILLAAGSGSRIGAARNKVLLEIEGRSMLEWSIDLFQRSSEVGQIVLVVASSELQQLSHLGARFRKVIRTVAGGKTRADSEAAGVLSIEEEIRAGQIEVVLVHDVARPFATTRLVKTVLGEVRRSGSAVPAIAPEDEVVETDGGLVTGTPGDLWAVQTPQGFLARDLLEVVQAARRENFRPTDTAALFERLGRRVTAIPGELSNIKVTTGLDLVRARAIARGLSRET